MAATGGVVAPKPMTGSNYVAPKPVNVTNPYMQGPTQAQINAIPGTSTKGPDPFAGWKDPSPPKPYVAPTPTATAPPMATPTTPAPAVPATPPSLGGINAAAGLGSAGDGGGGGDQPVRLAGMGSEAVAGMMGDQSGALRPLGRRMPPTESLALAGLGKRVY